MRNKKKVLGAVALASVLAATGSAFTAANSGVNSQVGGYQASSVTGVTVSSVVYAYSTNRAKLETVTFTPTTPVALSGVIAEVSTDNGVTWVTCPTGAPRGSTTAPIICTFPDLDTTAVTTMNFVVRTATSTPAAS